MREPIHEEKTARHLEYLSEAMGSGAQLQIKQLINSLSATGASITAASRSNSTA